MIDRLAADALKGPFRTLNALNGPFRTVLSGRSRIGPVSRAAGAKRWPAPRTEKINGGSRSSVPKGSFRALVGGRA
jgi:hypothetical protein